MVESFAFELRRQGAELCRRKHCERRFLYTANPPETINQRHSPYQGAKREFHGATMLLSCAVPEFSLALGGDEHVRSMQAWRYTISKNCKIYSERAQLNPTF